MDVLITVLLFIVIPALVFIGLGLYLMSKLVGGFGNLRALYRLFTGKGMQGARQGSAKTSASGKSSRTYNNKEKTTKRTAQTSGKMFEQNEGTYVDFEEVK